LPEAAIQSDDEQFNFDDFGNCEFMKDLKD